MDEMSLRLREKQWQEWFDEDNLDENKLKLHLDDLKKLK